MAGRCNNSYGDNGRELPEADGPIFKVDFFG